MKDAIRDIWKWDADEIVTLILLVNLILVIVYLLLHLSKRRWKKGLLVSVFMLSMPVVGPLYLLFTEIMQAIQKLFGDREVSMEELSFDQSRVRMIFEADLEKEYNMVPVEEALIIAGKTDKRGSFLEMLKGQPDGSVGVIWEAVGSMDAEVAHYAAAYLTDTASRIKARESALRNAFEEEATLENCRAYQKYLFEMLGMGIFQGAEQQWYLDRLERCYLWQLQKAPESCTTEDIASLAQKLMKEGELDAAKRWIDQIRPFCCEELESFKACAAYDFRCQDRSGLMELLEKVRYSTLELDSDSLEWIRFFERSG